MFSLLVVGGLLLVGLLSVVVWLTFEYERAQLARRRRP